MVTKHPYSVGTEESQPATPLRVSDWLSSEPPHRERPVSKVVRRRAPGKVARTMLTAVVGTLIAAAWLALVVAVVEGGRNVRR